MYILHLWGELIETQTQSYIHAHTCWLDALVVLLSLQHPPKAIVPSDARANPPHRPTETCKTLWMAARKVGTCAQRPCSVWCCHCARTGRLPVVVRMCAHN